MKIELEMSNILISKPIKPGKYLVFMKNENKEGWGWRFFDGRDFSTKQFDAPIVWWLESPPVPPLMVGDTSPPSETKLKRYLISWHSTYLADEGCTEPPFQVWIKILSAIRKQYGSKEIVAMHAVIDSTGEDEIWAAIGKNFPDYKMGLCSEVAKDFQPAAKWFPEFEGRTGLVAEDDG